MPYGWISGSTLGTNAWWLVFWIDTRHQCLVVGFLDPHWAPMPGGWFSGSTLGTTAWWLVFLLFGSKLLIVFYGSFFPNVIACSVGPSVPFLQFDYQLQSLCLIRLDIDNIIGSYSIVFNNPQCSQSFLLFMFDKKYIGLMSCLY